MFSRPVNVSYSDLWFVKTTTYTVTFSFQTTMDSGISLGVPAKQVLRLLRPVENASGFYFFAESQGDQTSTNCVVCQTHPNVLCGQQSLCPASIRTVGRGPMTASDGCEVKCLTEAERRSYPIPRQHSWAVKGSGSAGLLPLKEKPAVTHTRM